MKNASCKNLLQTALLAVTVCALPALAGPDTFYLGNGSDSALTVNTANTVINAYAQVTAPLAPGDTQIQVVDAAGFGADDLVLVLQTTGIVPEPPSGGPSPIDLTNNPVGRWELARLTSVTGTTLNLMAPMVHPYAANVTQVIRVPEYTDVTINATRSIVAKPWDGFTGGVVAFLATGTVTNNGTITVAGRGFRGGLAVDDASGTLGCTGLDEPAATGAQKGEGIAVTRYGVAQTGRGRVANGGGGGVCFKSGGGGGGNGGSGGQGGNTALTVDGNRAVGGEGGASLTLSTPLSMLDHLMMGGGGGAGHATDGAGQPGGAGGGIVFIRAEQLAGGGSIAANGISSSSSATDAASGGGAGGSIYLRIAAEAICGSIQATGGTGGSTGSIQIGPGGGGGGGRILFQKGFGTCTLSGTAVIGATPGTQLDPNAPGGASYGAQPGTDGSTRILPGGFPWLGPPIVLTPANGSSTNDTTPTYTGVLTAPSPPGTEAIIYVDGAEVGLATRNSFGEWTFTPTVPLPPGSHTVYAVAINTDEGLQSDPSLTHTFTVDTTPPAPPVVSTPADGSRTNDATPIYSGTAEAGSIVAVIVDGVEIGTTPADASGNWSFTPTAPLADGEHTVTATARDEVGNTSGNSNTHTFTVDTTPPAPPVVNTPANGSRTTDTTPTYSGTAEAGSIVAVIVDGVEIGTATADASGNWSFTPITGLGNGEHTVMATATDAADNTSGNSNTNTFTIDTVVPEAPVVTGPTDGTVTNDNTPVITGTAPPNTTVTVILDGTPVGTATPDAEGNWTFTPGTPLPDGPYVITATTTIPGGNTSVASDPVDFTVDTVVPDTTIVSGPSGETEDPDATFDFSSSEPGVMYECSLDGGDFSPCSDPATFEDLADGEHTLAVRARDTAGNVDSTPATATWNVRRPTPQEGDRDFLGDGIGCAASGGDPSSLAMMALALLSALMARKRRA